MPDVDGSNGEVVFVVGPDQAEVLLLPGKALSVLQGVASLANSAVGAAVLRASSSVGEADGAEEEEAFRALGADSVGVLDAFAVLLLALEEGVQEEPSGAGEALELVAVADLQAGGVELRTDSVGGKRQALSAQLAVPVSIVGQAVRTVDLARHSLLEVVARLALHTSVVLDVVAVLESAGSASYNEGAFTLKAARSVELEAVLDDAEVGDGVEDEGLSAVLAFTSLVDAADLLGLAFSLAVKEASGQAAQARPIVVVIAAVGIFNHALALKESEALLAGSALIVVVEGEAVLADAHTDSVNKGKSSHAGSATVSTIPCAVGNYTVAVRQGEG